MKTKINIILILVLFALPHITVYAQQNRNVVWVHGLGDNLSAWQHYATVFTNERKINSQRQSYTTSQGLSTAAAQLRNSVTTTTPTNLGIGHSMGGVMIREVDRITAANDKRFGGFITVASPNYGAPVISNVNAAHAAVATATNRLLSGPIAELGPIAAITWQIISGWVAQTVADYFIGNIAMIGTATDNDLKEGSPAMNTLNNFNSTAHRISIIAEETSPVHWRMAGSMAFGAGSSGNPGDEQMVGIINQIRGVYHNKFKQHETAANMAIFPFPNPAAHAVHTFYKNEWKKGRDWIDQSETIWCSLIKTSRLELKYGYYWHWIPCNNSNVNCQSIHELISAPLPPEQHYICDEWIQIPYTYWATVNYKSDGLLPTYTQELKGVPSGNRYVVDHANHMEVLNMKNSRKNGVLNDGTRNTLNAIFNRNQNNDWFYTPKYLP